MYYLYVGVFMCVNFGYSNFFGAQFCNIFFEMMTMTPPPLRLVAVAVAALASSGAFGLDDGLCRTPVMGMNSWTVRRAAA